MIKKSSLRSVRRNRFESGEASPMENVANLVDVMLVFACALMIAIITYWNVDIGSVQNIDKSKLEEVDGMKENVQDSIDSDKYKSKGTVYEDPETGELYIVEN